MRYTFFILSALISFSLFGQVEWELKKNENNIKIYTRAVQGSSFKEFRAVGILKGKSSDVIDILKKPDNYIHWMPDCLNAYLINRDGNNGHTHYIENKAPWPVSNRDMVIKFDYSQKTDKTYLILVNCHPTMIPEKEGIVRIQKLTGYWNIEQLSETEVKITYQIHAEPNGNIPSNLVNTFIVDSPYRTLIEMQKLLKK